MMKTMKKRSIQSAVLCLLMLAVVVCGFAGVGTLRVSAEDHTDHEYSEIGVCTCGVYEPAVQVTNDNYTSLGLTNAYVGYYAVESYGQFLWIRDYINNGNSATNFVLTADIDFSPLTNDDLWVPITDFSGIFDGGSHRIKNLSLDSVGTAGIKSTLFWRSRNSTYRNVIIDSSCYFKGLTAPLVSIIKEGSWEETYAVTLTFENCGNEAKVNTSTGYSAGLAVLNNINARGSFLNCYNAGNVSGASTHGAYGIATNRYSNFYNCYNTGTITAGTSNAYPIGAGTTNNCYDSGTNPDGFASGEVAYLLSQGVTVSDVFYSGAIWGQDLTTGEGDEYTDARPVLGGATVYRCNGYSNSNVHQYTEYVFDDTTHWMECTCGEKSGEAAVPHDHSLAKYDGTNHWNECECGHQADVATHVTGDWAYDETHHWKPCTGCKIDTISRAEHAHSEDWTVDSTTAYHLCECGHQADIRALSYSVTFAANGGTGVMANESVTYTADTAYDYTVPACGLTYANRVFTGWLVSVGGNELGIKQAGDVLDVNGDVVLTAQWKINFMFETDPVAKSGLVYSGAAQVLLTEGTVNDAAQENGTVKYRLGTDGEWSVSIPTATNAGSYTVYYGIFEGEDGPYDEGSVTVTVAAKSITPTIENLEDHYYKPGLGVENPSEPTVTLTANGETVDPVNYTVSYTNNTANGTATVTVTANADGNYSFEPVSKDYQLTDHMHFWEYSVDETNKNVGYATCTSTDGGACVEGRVVTFTLTASNATYDGAPKAATLLVDQYFEASAWAIIYCDEEGNSSLDPPTDAGTWVAGVAFGIEVEIQIEFVIEQMELTLVWSDTELTYNGSEQKPAVRNTTPLPADADAVILTVTGAWTDAGSYTATATVDSDNYTLTNATQEFSIVPSPLTLEWSNLVFTYDGEAHLPTAVIADGGVITGDTVNVAVSFDGLGVAISANTYSAVATIDNSNYTLTNASQEFTIEILELDAPVIDPVVYNRSLQTADVAQSTYYTVTTNAGGINAGAYDVVLTLTDFGNIKWKDSDTDTLTLKFVIQKETIDHQEFESVYTGEAQAPTLIPASPFKLVTTESFTNVGEYEVVLQLVDTVNYAWSTPKTEDASLATATFTITKATNEWVTEPSIEDWHMTEEPSAPVYEARFGNETVKVVYYPKSGSVEDATEKAPTACGTYVAQFTVAGTDNYTELTVTVEFEILPPYVSIGGWALPKLHYMDTFGNITATQPTGGYAYLRADGVLVLNNFVIDATIFNTIEITAENEHLYVYPFSTESGENSEILSNPESSVILLNGETTIQLIGQNSLRGCGNNAAIGNVNKNASCVTLRGGTLQTNSIIFAQQLVIENCGITATYISADVLNVRSSSLFVGVVEIYDMFTLTDSVVESGYLYAERIFEVNNCAIKAVLLYVPDGDLIAKNSTFVMEGDVSIAIEAESISMTSCEITATSANCVFRGYSIWLTDCEITATGAMCVFEGSRILLTDCTVEMTGCGQFIFGDNGNNADATLNNCEIKSTGENIDTEESFIVARHLKISGGSISIEKTNVGLMAGTVVARNAKIEIGFLIEGIRLMEGGSFEGCTVTLNGNLADLPSGSSCWGIVAFESYSLEFVKSSLTVTAPGGIAGGIAISLMESNVTVTATKAGVLASVLELDGASTLNVTIVESPEEDTSTETTEAGSFGVTATALNVYDDRSVISIKLNEGVTGKALAVAYSYGNDIMISAPEGATLQALPQEEGVPVVFYEVVVINGETVTYPTAVTISYVEDEEEPEPTEEKIVVGGVELADGEYLDNNGTVSTEKPAGGYAYLSDGVLTLHNFTYTGIGYLYNTEIEYYNESEYTTYEEYAGIYSTVSLTLRLEGKNLLDLTTFAGDRYIYGIFVDADLTLEGDGVLEISSTDDGIEVWGDLTGSGCTIRMTTGGEGFDVYGNVLLENCKLTLDVVDDGIWASEDIVLTDCTVEITSSGSDGIRAYGGATLIDCTIGITAVSDGIDAEGDLIAIGCEIVIVAEDHGIEGSYNITLTDCVLNVTATDDGINTEYNVTLTNCTGTVTSSEYGIYVEGALTLKGCELTVTSNGDAIYTHGDVFIENSTLTVSGYNGIYFVGEGEFELTILDSTLYIDTSNFGIYIESVVNASNSRLNITSGEEAIYSYVLTMTDCTGSIHSRWYEAIYVDFLRMENCSLTLWSDNNTTIWAEAVTIIGGELELYGDGLIVTPMQEYSYVRLSNVKLYLESWGDYPVIETYTCMIEGSDTEIWVYSDEGAFVCANDVSIDKSLAFMDDEGYELYFDRGDGYVYDEQKNGHYTSFALVNPDVLIGEDDTVITAPTLTIGDKVLENGQYLGNNGEVTDEMPAGGFAYYYDGTLILKDFVLETEGTALTTINGEAIVAGIYCDSNLTIRLMGKNSIKLTSEGSVGIAIGEGNLTVTGDGSLALDCAGTGIEVIGDLTVDGTALTVKAVGIAVEATNAQIQNATVTVEVSGGANVYGIQVNNSLDVMKSTLTVNAASTLVGTDTDFVAYAIRTMIGKVCLLDSSVTLTSDDSGISAPKINVTNCDLTVDAVDGGLMGWSAITLSDSTVTVTANGENSIGLLVIDGTLAVADSILTVSTSNIAIQAVSIQIAEDLAILIPADGKIASFDGGYSILDSTELVAAQVTIGAAPKVTVEADSLTIGGVEISDGEYLDNSGNITTEKPEGGYAYLKDGVLTLNNFVYQTKKYDSFEGISCKTDLTLVLIGENLINSYDQYAIRVDGSLTVSGDGSLTVETKSIGISVKDTLTVDCDALTVTAGDVAVEADDIVFLGDEIKLTVIKGKNAVIANKSITLGERMAVSSPEGAIVQKIDGKYVFTDANGNTVTELTITWAAHDCIDEDLFDHLCDICGKATLTCKDTDLDHACDACGGEMGYHADTNGDHICEYGCDVTIGTCEDQDTDHDCDYGCDKFFGACEDTDKDHACDYGCGAQFGDHTDVDHDHKCDYGCSKAYGTCEDQDTDHNCDYGCSKTFGTCADADRDHDCDYGCDKVFGTCEDQNNNHDCDYGCNEIFGVHIDTDPKDHTCDYGCSVKIGDHTDLDHDHVCDYGCATKIGTCEDQDTDHNCDYGCDEIFGVHVDTDPKDHTCDYGCSVKIGDHTDLDHDHICDYGCATKIGTCEDQDTDHDCDYGCDEPFGEHTAASGTHFCDYCNGVVTACKDVDSNHVCDICGDELKHTYSTTWKKDANLHWHECSCGAKKDVAIHTLGAAATETEAQTCTVCEYVIAPATGHVNHKAKTEWSSDTTHHWHECTDCSTQQMNKAVHVYDNDCDTACNTCGAVRTISHSYGTSFKADETNHWYECTVCQDKKDVTAHTAGAAATETEAQTCTVCGYIIAPATGHVQHTAKTEWESDGTHHWHDCTGCGTEKLDRAEHTYDSDCDTDCNVCGKNRTVSHDYKAEWVSDETGHWHECSDCGNKINKADHTFSVWIVTKEATATEKGSKTKTCACGFSVSEDIPAMGITSEQETTGDDTPAPTPSIDEDDEGLGAGAVAAIVVGSTVVVGAGVFAIWWFAISKRTLGQLGAACKGVGSKIGGACKGAFGKVKSLFTKK